MSYPREIKEYYRDAFQQAKNQGDSSLIFSDFVAQEKKKILSIVKEFTVENGKKKEVDWVGVTKRLRDEGKISKFIPLTTLQKIVQFSGKEGFELENVFNFPANTITQNGELQQTAVPRIDDLVQSQSDSEFTFAVEWISNAIDAVSPHKQIGRFGEGFFQSLQHLQDEGNEIQVESKSGDSDAYKVSLRKQGDDLYVAPSEHVKYERGTCVSLKKDLGEIKKQKLQEYISAKFRANTRAIITLNGQQINNFGKYNYINGQDSIHQDSLPHISIELNTSGIKVSDTGVGMDSHDLAGKLLYPNTTSKKREKVSDDDVKKLSPNETRFFYTHKQDKKDKTHISLQVAGVIIEDFHVASVGNIGECVFEFPSFSPLEDSRNEIKVGRETTISLTSALEKIAHKTKNTQDKLGLLEVIGSIYHHIKDRPTNIVDEDFTLETNMKRTFKGIKEDIEKTGVTILPAEEKIMNCFGSRDDIFYIDPDFIDFQVESIPGISEISESVLGRSTTKQGKKVRFFEVDFDVGATHDYVLGEEYVLINKTVFAEKTDEQRDMLIQVINIGVNLNTSYEMESERVSYGRLPTSSEGEIVVQTPKEKRAVISLESIQNRTKQASGSSSDENIEEYDYASEIAYIDQELEAFEEKYIVKFPKSISSTWKAQDFRGKKEREAKIIHELKDGMRIEDVIIKWKVFMILGKYWLQVNTGELNEAYAILLNFLESKNSSLTIPTFVFLSNLVGDMSKDIVGFLRYTQTLFKALDQDPKNVITLIQEFTQKREIWENDPYVGHLERTRVTKTDLSAFGVFRDIVQEKQKSLIKQEVKKNEITPETIEYDEKYELDISRLNIIAENLFLSGTRRQIWALEILEEIPKLSSKKLASLRSYLLTTDTTVLELKKIQEILGGELGKVETNIDMFDSLQSIFREENRIKEQQKWANYRDVSWLDDNYCAYHIGTLPEYESQLIIKIRRYLLASLEEGNITTSEVIKLRKLILTYQAISASDPIRDFITEEVFKIIPHEAKLSITAFKFYFLGENIDDFDKDTSHDDFLREYGYQEVDGKVISIGGNNNTDGYILNTAKLSAIAEEQISERIRDESSIQNLIIGLNSLPKDTLTKYKNLLLSDKNLDLNKVKKVFDQTSFENLYMNIPSEKWLFATNMLRIVFETEEKEITSQEYTLDTDKLIDCAHKLYGESVISYYEAVIKELENLSQPTLQDFRNYILNESPHQFGKLYGILRDDFGNLFPGCYSSNEHSRKVSRISHSFFEIFTEEEKQLKESSEEGEEYFFPVDWEAKIEKICGGEDSSRMKSIIDCMIKHVYPRALYTDIYQYFTGNSMDVSGMERYLDGLSSDAGIDLRAGIDVSHFLDYFHTFFYKEENESEYKPDMMKLDTMISKIFTDEPLDKTVSENIRRLRNCIGSLDDIGGQELYKVRKLLLEDDYAMGEIFTLLPYLKELPMGEARFQIVDMLKQVFRYELNEHKKLSKKSEQEIEEDTQDTGTYQFPDDIMDIIEQVLPENKEFERKVVTKLIESLKTHRTPQEIYEVRESLLSGEENLTSFIRLFGTLDQADGYNKHVDFSTYTPGGEKENARKIFLAMKEIFEYEINQKEWGEYYKYSYLNPNSNIGEVRGSERYIYNTILDLRKRAGETQFMRLFTDIRRKVYLLDYIGGFNNIKKAGQEMGFTTSEIQDIKEKLHLSLDNYFTEKDIGYDQLSEYLENEFNFKEDDYDNMLLEYSHSHTLRRLGYTPTISTKQSSEGKKEETKNISDVKLPEEFFMSLSGKYSPDIIAFAQFLESNGEYLSPRESKVEISESGVISTSLSQIIATSLKENSALTNGINLSRFTELLSASGETQKQFQDIIAGVCLAQDEVSMYFLREGIQNARDALISAGKSESPILIDAYDRDGKFATSVSDNVGMELSDIIVKLLTPYNSGKNGIDSTGKFGKGFFTFAVGCSELRIKSSTGNGTVSYIKMIPQLTDGIITDFEVFIEEKQEEFTGTTIERVDELGGIHGNLRALIGTHLLKKYVGNTEAVDIDFAGTVINSPTGKTLIEESPTLQDKDGKDIGSIKIYKTKDNTERFTKDNLWISDIKEDILNDFPDWIIDFVRNQKYSIDIPSGTPLVGSRNSIENREYYVNLFKPHIYKMVVQIVLSEHVGGSLKIPMMPEDYLALLQYEYKTNDGVTAITRRYNSGEELTSSDIESLKDKAHMAQFLTEVEFDYRGEKTSLRAIKKKLHEDTLERQNYGSRFQSKIVQANEQKDSLNQRPEKHNLSYREITELTGLSKYKIQKFKKFISDSLDPVITERFGGVYNISFHMNPKGGEIASSYGNGGVGCSFRVDTPEFKRLVEDISSPKTQERVMDIVAHEMTHNVEDTLGARKWGTHEADELHDASFMRINREIITQLGRGVISA